MKTADVICKVCETVLGSVSFPDEVSDAEVDVRRRAYLCETHAASDNTAQIAAMRGELATTDTGMGRVVEDILDLLKTAGHDLEPDLPQVAKDKLTKRRALREQLTGLEE